MGSLPNAIKARDTRLRGAMYGELQEIVLGARGSLRQVTAKWENKPDFRLMFVRGKKELTGRVILRGKGASIFRYVDEGTRPHIIRPRNAPFLRFRLGYSAKTRPIAKFNVGTGKATGAHIQTLLVLHPGNKARQFNKTIARGIRSEFRKRILKALAKVQ